MCQLQAHAKDRYLTVIAASEPYLVSPKLQRTLNIKTYVQLTWNQLKTNYVIKLKGDQIRNCSLIGQSWKVTEPYLWTGWIWLSVVLINNEFGELLVSYCLDKKLAPF